MEELYTVSFALDCNYSGRDENGRIRTAPAGCGTLMTRDCAEKLCQVLKRKYPSVRVVEIFRDERDELAATSLEDLNEGANLSDLTEVIEQLLIAGFSREDILAKCSEVFGEVFVAL